jgi:hypothetical protein
MVVNVANPKPVTLTTLGALFSTSSLGPRPKVVGPWVALWELNYLCMVGTVSAWPIHMGSQAPLMVANPNMEAKSRLFEPQDTLRIWMIIIKVGSWTCFEQICMGLVLRVRCSFVLDPIMSAGLKPHPWKVLPCKHPCHIGDLRLGTSCAVKSPNFCALNGWDCTDWPRVTWDLGRVWSGPKFKQGGWVGVGWPHSTQQRRWKLEVS